MKRFMRAFIDICMMLAIIAVAVGTPAYAAQKEKHPGPVILMLDPLDPEGAILRGENSDHKSSVIIVERNHRRLGIAVVPGLVSENVVTEPYLNSDDTHTHRIISTNAGDFQAYKDSAISDIIKYSEGPAALSATDALSRTPMYITQEYCGSVYCTRRGSFDCICMSNCYDCYFVRIIE